MIISAEVSCLGDGSDHLLSDVTAILLGPEGLKDGHTEGFDVCIDAPLEDPPIGAGPDACPGEQAKVLTEGVEVTFGHGWQPGC